MPKRKLVPFFVGALLLSLLTPLAAGNLSAQTAALTAPQSSLAPLGPGQQPVQLFKGAAAFDHLGNAVSVGDVNGDGLADLLYGAPNADAPNAGSADNAGAFSLWLGNKSPFFKSGATLYGDRAYANLGEEVAIIGDVNGDGYRDIAATRVDGTSARRVDVFYGFAGGFQAAPAFTATGPTGSWYGKALAGGDVNGDGYADLFIGAPLQDNGETDEGAVTVYYGSSAGLALGPTFESNQAGAQFGYAVAYAGDVNGDGFGDLLIGAPRYDHIISGNTKPDAGMVYYYKGGATGLATQPTTTLAGREYELYGTALAGNGDLNGDAHMDALIGVPNYTAEGQIVGKVVIYLGDWRGLANGPFTAFGEEPGAGFGQSVAFVGDVGADGYEDILIGAPLSDQYGTDSGYAALYRGNGVTIADTPWWVRRGDHSGDLFGSDLAGGDFNGDGISDLAVAAPNYSESQLSDIGAVYVFAGTPDNPNPIPGCGGTATPYAPGGAPPVGGLLERRVANCHDDAHERTDTSEVFATSDTLTTGVGPGDGSVRYAAGLLFRDIVIPRGSHIISATLQLKAEYQNLTTTIPLTIVGNDTGQARDFFGVGSDITDRERTSSSVPFTLTQRTSAWVNSPDLSAVIQEIVDREDWATGNSLALLIDALPQTRNYATWDAFEANPDRAGRLSIRFDLPSTETPTATPTVTVTPTATLTPTETPTRTSHVLYLPTLLR